MDDVGIIDRYKEFKIVSGYEVDTIVLAAPHFTVEGIKPFKCKFKM